MDYSNESSGLLAGFGFIMFMLFGLAFHLFFGYCFKKIAEKTGDTDTSLWWIPIVNLLLIIKAADKPAWWIVLLLIPLVNIIVLFIVWIDVSNNLGKGTGWGVVAALIGIIGIPYLAFSDDTRPAIA
jgi:hypothetical protein